MGVYNSLRLDSINCVPFQSNIPLCELYYLVVAPDVVQTS